MTPVAFTLLVLAAPGIDPGVAAYDHALRRATEVRTLVQRSRARLHATAGTPEAAGAAELHRFAVATWSASEKLLIVARYGLTERLHGWLGLRATTWTGADQVAAHRLLWRLERALASSVRAVEHAGPVARARVRAARDVLGAYRRFRARPRPAVPNDAARLQVHLRAMMDLDRRLMWFFDVAVDGPLRQIGG